MSICVLIQSKRKSTRANRRLLSGPGSERHTHNWSQHVSGLDELLGTDFTHLSLNSLYQISDKLVAHQSERESHLRHQECSLFGLDEKIILYDLTNTYFEGVAASNKKAKFGRSKEKRSDCRLVTLGLVLDGHGFPKASRVFAGNKSEPKSLKKPVQRGLIFHQIILPRFLWDVLL